LTLRSYSDEVRNHTVEAVKRITRGLAQAAGLPEDRYPVVTIANESSPATYNNPELSQRLLRVFDGAFGTNRTVRTKPIMGAEDFGLFGRTEHKIPICMFWLGTVDGARFKEYQSTGKPLPALHSSQYLPTIRPTLETGIAAMTSAALDLLAR
jgi:hippurate hydrolase